MSFKIYKKFGTQSYYQHNMALRFHTQSSKHLGVHHYKLYN